LQRRLKYLAENNLLSIEGKTRARLYQLPSSSTTAAVQAAHKKGFLSLSLAAHSIQVKVSQPIQARIPVSYRRVFLDKYRPNETYYLPLQVRRHLFQLGKSPMIERPAGTYARQILSRLLIDLSWNSSRLEGNTYSLLETKRLLELGEVAEGKNAKEAQMILNHKAAIEFLVESADGAGFNRYTILNLHALLSHNLLSDSGACGRLRTIPVEIGESTYQPLAVPQLIQECFQQILDTANAIENPLEQAFFVMVHIPYLQPFEDVNKRVSRLAANMPLIRQNLCPLSFTDVPEDLYISGLLGIYELNRIELLRDIFIWAYERSCLAYSSTRQTLGEPDPFRLKYRDHIFEVTTRIVRLCLSLNDAKHIIQEQAKEISPAQEQARFIEIVEAEVKGLHEGNIARYRLRPSEYEAWQNATSARK
jgi:Fic family protein